MTKMTRNGLALPRHSRSNLRLFMPREPATRLARNPSDALGYAAKQQPAEPPTPVGADDDEVGWPLLRLLFNRVVKADRAARQRSTAYQI
jgi:hypothetical protein